jgi:hypothetical protein
MAVCAETTPPETEVADGHRSACWLHATGLTGAQARPLTRAAGPDGQPASSIAEGGEET